MTFKQHIQLTQKKLSSKVGLIYKVRSLLPVSCRRAIFFSLIHSHITFCIEIYGAANKRHLKPLQLIQNKALRALQFRSRFYPNNELHKFFNILKLSDLYRFKVTNLIRSILHDTGRIPEPIRKLVRRRGSVHTHNTRKAESLLYVARHRTKIAGRKHSDGQPSKYWNSLPNAVQSATSSNSFKTAYYDWTFTNYPNSGRIVP